MFKALTPLIGIIIAVGLFFSYVQPTFRDVKTIQDETAEYAQATERASELMQRINGLKAQQGGILPVDLERLEALIPDRIDEVSALIDIDALTVAHHLMLGDIEVGEQGQTESGAGAAGSQPGAVGTPAQMPGAMAGADDADGFVFIQAGESLESQYSTLDVGFSVTGTYDDFRMFLSDIERSLVLMEVTSITFAASEGDAIPFTMKVRLYSLNAPAS